MTVIAPLADLMVAPNGSRLQPADHPAVPTTIAETVADAMACHTAGAGAIHAHTRDAQGNHVLDAGLAREMVFALEEAVPGMDVQVTTEAVGRYSPSEQRDFAEAVAPKHLSFAVREMFADTDAAAALDFYAWAHETGCAVQHICYDARDVLRLRGLVETGLIETSGGNVQALFTLGRHKPDQKSVPADLDPFLHAAPKVAGEIAWDFAVCAFGQLETECLAYGAHRGAKVRVGFENNTLNADGTVASDNAERVREVANRLAQDRVAPSRLRVDAMDAPVVPVSLQAVGANVSA